MDSPTECAVCGVPASLRCARCKAVYCSRAHQALLWPAHKMLCGKDSFRQPPLTGKELEICAFGRPDAGGAGIPHHSEIGALLTEAFMSCPEGSVIRDVLQDVFSRHTKSFDPATLNAALADLRAAMFNVDFYLPLRAGLSYNPFYLTAKFLSINANMPGTPPINADKFDTFLRSLFDYFSLFYFPQSNSKPDTFKTKYLERAWIRTERLVEGLRVLPGFGGLNIYVFFVLMRSDHKTMVRFSNGVAFDSEEETRMRKVDEREGEKELAAATVLRARRERRR